MEWQVTLNGRELSEIEPDKLKVLSGRSPTTQEEWRTLAALVLEVVGVRGFVHAGDSRLWRFAIAEVDIKPLPALNLPLAIWDAYQAHPFDGITLRFENGETMAIADWSQFYYCWHTRKCGLHRENVVTHFDATLVVAAEHALPPSTLTTTLERLNWLKNAETFLAFGIRTRQGQGFLIQSPNEFCLDASASLLAIFEDVDKPLQFVRVADIVSVRIAKVQPEALLTELESLLKAIPYVPFHVRILNGKCVTVRTPNEVIITKEDIYISERTTGSKVSEDAIRLPLRWIDRLEVLKPDNEHV